jgi:hypothetical protein
MKRLGKNDGEHPRAMLVEFPSWEIRKEVLEKAKHLKTQKKHEELKKVFLKRDQHPVWRKEESRLRRVVKEERQKPANEGVNIEYKAKEKIVTRDGLTIDRFQPFLQ